MISDEFDCETLVGCVSDTVAFPFHAVFERWRNRRSDDVHTCMQVFYVRGNKPFWVRAFHGSFTAECELLFHQWVMGEYNTILN